MDAKKRASLSDSAKQRVGRQPCRPPPPEVERRPRAIGSPWRYFSRWARAFTRAATAPMTSATSFHGNGLRASVLIPHHTFRSLHGRCVEIACRRALRVSAWSMRAWKTPFGAPWSRYTYRLTRFSSISCWPERGFGLMLPFNTRSEMAARSSFLSMISLPRPAPQPL